MPKLGKSQRDALKASGQWKQFSVTPPVFDGAAEFCRLAAEANKDPVPNVPQHWSIQTQGSYRFTVDHEQVGQAANDFLKSGDFFEYKEDLILDEKLETSTSDGCFFDAMMLNLSNRVIETSGLTETSGSTRMPVIGIPHQVATYVELHGEFNDGEMSATYADSHALAKAFAWCASQCVDVTSAMEAIDRLWLPNSPNDGHSKHVIASSLSDYLKKHGIFIGLDDLSKSIFSGLMPRVVADAINMLPDEHQEHVPKLFWTFKDAPAFHKFFGDPEFQILLREMNLRWKNPSPKHMCFNKSFRDLAKDAEKRWKNRHFKFEGSLYYASTSYGFSENGSHSQLVLRGKGKGEFFAPGKYANLDNIIEASSFNMHSYVVGPEMAYITVGFDTKMPYSDFDTSSDHFRLGLVEDPFDPDHDGILTSDEEMEY